LKTNLVFVCIFFYFICKNRLNMIKQIFVAYLCPYIYGKKFYVSNMIKFWNLMIIFKILTLMWYFYKIFFILYEKNSLILGLHSCILCTYVCGSNFLCLDLSWWTIINNSDRFMRISRHFVWDGKIMSWYRR
jgi:hypothetical protein